MNKEFLTVETIRDNALLLAKKIYDDNFIPTVIYVGLRGGTTLGNVISEYFKLIAEVDKPPLYATVVAHSYQAFQSIKKVHIDGWTYNPEFLRHSDKILLVDDIFDSGLTINVIARKILEQGISASNLKIAVHDFKIRTFLEEKHVFEPDYYSRKIVINSKEEDNWIHYLSHELEGLHADEIKEHYSSEVHGIIDNILAIRCNNLRDKSSQLDI